MQVAGAVACVGPPVQEQDAGRSLAGPAKDQGRVKGNAAAALWRWLRRQLQHMHQRACQSGDVTQ